MRLKDSFIKLYIENFLLPGMEDYTHPGFIYTKFTEDSQTIVLRDVFISEDWVAELEVKTIEKYGEEGRKLLYTIGKNCGYTYAKFSRLKTVNTASSKKDLLSFLEQLFVFTAGTYGADVDYNIDLDKKVVNASFSKYVVCNLNGMGELFMSGSGGGIWAWIQQDTNMEGIHPKCIGRKDSACELMMGPHEVLNNIKPCYSVKEMQEVDITVLYLEMNKPQALEMIKTSLDSLIQADVVKLQGTEITYHNKRFFEVDAHYIYIIEKLYPDKQLLYEITKQYFKKLGETIPNLTPEYIAEFLGALGWGEAIFAGESVEIKNYPFTELHQDTNYPIIRGIIAGLAASIDKTDINYPTVEPILDTNSYSIIIR